MLGNTGEYRRKGSVMGHGVGIVMMVEHLALLLKLQHPSISFFRPSVHPFRYPNVTYLVSRANGERKCWRAFSLVSFEPHVRDVLFCRDGAFAAPYILIRDHHRIY
jgi:hypothetical protein